MKLMPALTAVAAVALVACGAVNGGNAVLPTPISPPVGALAGWSSFPAEQKPRPIVWLQNLSPDGYGTGQAKMAAYCNKYVAGSVLTTAVPASTVATWADGTSATYRGISASVALAALAADKSHAQDPQCSSTPPIFINGARLGSFDFITDRGRANMTAWLFTAVGVNGKVAYPAIVPSAFWKGSIVSQFGTGAALLSADGRSITYTFYGTPSRPGPCGADYKGVVAESRSAVAIALQEFPHAAPAQGFACDAMAQQRFVTVALAQPLAGRVLVDGSGNVTWVCPSTKPDC